MASWPKLRFSSWVLRWNNPLATFPRDRTEGPRKRPQNCPQDLKKWLIALTSPLADGLPARPRTPNPWCPVIVPCGICHLNTSGELGLLHISFLFSWWAPLISNIAGLSPRPFLVCSVWLCERGVDKLFLFDDKSCSVFHDGVLARSHLQSFASYPAGILFRTYVSWFLE